MRDIVSENGTFYTGLTALPAIAATQTSPAIALAGFDGAMIYILAGTWTDGSFTPVIQVAPDNNGSPGSWVSAPVADLVAWIATSPTNFTPVKVGQSQPAAMTSAATALNQRIGYIGNADWLRVVTTVAGATTGMTMDAIVNLGRPRFAPSAV